MGSVLLFNSSENPYKKYVTLDNLEGVGGIDREKQQAELAAAPQTLVDGANLPSWAKPQFVYSPDLGDVPTFDLPQNLPLANLADIRFSTETASRSIAPSVSTVPGLPSVEQFLAAAPPTAHRKQPPAAPLPTPPPANATAAGAFPQPPPLSSAIPSAPPIPVPPPVPSATRTGPATYIGNIPPPPPVPAGVIPAPPPVPAGFIPVPPPVGSGSIPAPPPVPAPAPASASAKVEGAPAGRSDLLAQIRNPNFKLRKVQAEVVREKKEQQHAAKAEAAAGGGDMMSALKNLLALRRQATSNRADRDAAATPKGRKGRAASDASEDDASGEDIPKVPQFGAPAPGSRRGKKKDTSDSEWQ